MNDERQASVIEMAPVRPAAERYDVAILGGGLAGLTLSIQLKRARPRTSVAVLEKREGPAPLAAFKVGESTVLPGAHYFAEVVGMRDHLDERQFRKTGLRFYPPAGDNGDITRRVESGPPAPPETRTWQIDRGLFENELAARARELGVEVLQGCRVGDVTLGDDLHTVSFQQLGQDASTRARWVVDAAGRASLLKRKLGLSRQVGHTINAAWFRLAGGLDFERWGADDEEWMARMVRPGLRGFSTAHLMGEGYWVWLIPLATGPVSIGVCADPRLHPFEEIGELHRMVAWLRAHEPQVAEAVEPRLGSVEDFLRVEDFAYGVERAFSADRWCLVGEAAAFADPFISPGSDMIAYSNTFTSDLVTRDLDGEDVSERVDFFNESYQRMFAHALARTEDMYPVFGNPWVMSIKFSWDAYLAQSGHVLAFVKGRLADIDYMRSVEREVHGLQALNINMHGLLREWHELERRPWERELVKTGLVPAIRDNLHAPVEDYTDEELREKLREQLRVVEALSVIIFHRAARALPEPPDESKPVNPYAVGLRPERWEADGLHSEPGMTLADALALVEGAEWLWLDHVPSGA